MSDSKIKVTGSADSASLEVQGAAIDRIIHSIADLISPFTSLGGVVGQEMEIFRLSRLQKALEIAQRLREHYRIDVSPVSNRFLIEWRDQASLEDENDLSEKWAALLLSAASGEKAIHRLFLRTLNQLGRSEIELLEALFNQITTDRLGTVDGKLSYYGDQLAEGEIRERWNRDLGNALAIRHRHDQQRSRSVDGILGEGWVESNFQSILLLRTLGLVDISSNLDDVEYSSVYLTPLGEEFVSACRPKSGLDLQDGN